MKKFGVVVYVGVVGLLTGVVIGEFFPKLFNNNIMGSIGSAVSDPFSKYRNELAIKYAIIGLVIGAVIGIGFAMISKKK